MKAASAYNDGFDVSCGSAVSYSVPPSGQWLQCVLIGVPG